MLGSHGIRTDLALEATERFTEENVEVRGVEVTEDYNEEKDIRTTVVKITTENGARTMGRPQGNFSRDCQTSEKADKSGAGAVDSGSGPWKFCNHCRFPWPSCSRES